MFMNRNTLLLAAMLAITAPLIACDPIAGRETPGEYVDDATITGKVIAAIIDDPILKKSEVKVETFQNVVQLSGWVDSNASINRAGDVARNIKGVRSVRNDLIVR
ncbi:MAG: BON domain-containing protein [Rhodospirillales bacterium]